jgi:hypothetical protein
MQRFDDAMAMMADSLTEIGDVKQALARITTAAVQSIPGADLASISVRHADGTLETSVGTEPLVYQADLLQYQLREGPCYDALIAEYRTYSRDLSADRQWPRFGPRAAEMGLLSQKGIQLAADKGKTTGLNLYSRTVHAFDDDHGLAELFASHARVALGYATHLKTLSGALETRETIGKAIGIVMERYDLPSERAFEFLIRMSQNTNVKLRDLAKTLIERRQHAID